MDHFSVGNIIVSGIGAVNLGFIVWSVKTVIAPLKVVIDGMQREIDNQKKNIEELYGYKNNTSERLTKIETVHKIRGCNEIKSSRT